MPKTQHPDLTKQARQPVLKELQRFVREQMDKFGEETGQISQQAYADSVGFGQSTLSRILASKPGEMDVTNLIKLARHSKTDIRDLIALISPSDVLRDTNPETLALALKLNNLSDSKRKLLDTFLRTLINDLDER